jgi:hypothetical protein
MFITNSAKCTKAFFHLVSNILVQDNVKFFPSNFEIKRKTSSVRRYFHPVPHIPKICRRDPAMLQTIIKCTTSKVTTLLKLRLISCVLHIRNITSISTVQHSPLSQSTLEQWTTSPCQENLATRKQRQRSSRRRSKDEVVLWYRMYRAVGYIMFI